MYKINEKQFNEMPQELKILYEKLPNHSSEEVVSKFPDSKSNSKNSIDKIESNKSTFGSSKTRNVIRIADSGSASRFFYCAKASKSERNKGCEEIFVLKEKIPEDDLNEIKHLLSI